MPSAYHRKLAEVGAEKKQKDLVQISFPAGHQAGMKVPKGGSMCANCEYLGDDKLTCTSEGFIAWEGPEKPAGSATIPGPIDEYCSDWYEEGEDGA